MTSNPKRASIATGADLPVKPASAGARQTCRGRPQRSRGLRIAALSLAALAVACAGTEQRSSAADYDAYDATRLFAVGYHDIADIYIDDVQIPELALAGMSGLERIDPAFDVARRDGFIEVTVAGAQAGRYRVPGPKNHDGWGSVTASVLDTGLRRSEAIGQHQVSDLYERIFDGVLAELDPYSRYAGAERARDNRASRDGFGGVGATVEATAEGIRVLSVRAGGPAAEAGLQAGDLIVRVDDTETPGLQQREVIDLLRGRVDTRVDLLVRRPAVKGHLRLSAQRMHIVPETIAFHREGDAAYLRLSGFNQETAASLEQTIERAKRDIGGGLEGYILDLRGNPGGLLDQAVDVSDLFVSEGRIVSTHGRHPDSHQYFSARRDDHGDGRPVVVLIDRGSASAAEIVAAAIQDSGRGIVVGSGSYGKGTVQTVLRLPNQGELTLTWARFHAPSGYALSKRGVLPDVCTSRIDGSAETITAALRAGQLPVDGKLRRRSVAPDDAKGLSDLRAECPPRHRGDSGTDVEVARRLLHDRDLFRLAVGKPSPSLAKAEP